MGQCEDGQACMAIGATGGIGQQRVQSRRRLFLQPPFALAERSVGQFTTDQAPSWEMAGCTELQPLMQVPHVEELRPAD